MQCSNLDLSAGFFAGKVKAPEDEAPSGGRFDPNTPIGKMYRARYLKQGYFDALKLLQAVAVRYLFLLDRYHY